MKLLAGLLRPHLRERDTFARLGGDEFGILLEHCPPGKALEIAEEVRRRIEAFRFSWKGKSFSLGVSVGLVNLGDVSTLQEDPLKLADTACYAAKDAGRNRVHLYQVEDRDILKRQGEMDITAQINRALERDLFELYFQPIVSIQQFDKPAIEILLRMIDFETGALLAPGGFLPAAERYGLIEKIDRWTVSNTLKFFKQKPELLDVLAYVSINLSGQSLGSDEFLAFVRAEFIENGVPYNKVGFEITETSAILNFDHATRFIKKMRSLGCQFLLDDFGSGMSSFTYLKQLTVDKLKIDGTFVRDIVHDKIDQAMVRSINDIGHAVNMQTVAEFVENDEIMSELAYIGVDYVQGYGIDKPAPVEGMCHEALSEVASRVWEKIGPEFCI